MKNLFTLLFSIVIINCYAQNDSTKIVTSSTGEAQEILVLDELSVPKTNPAIDSLKLKLDSLDHKLANLLDGIAENESVQYQKNYNNLSNAVNIINEVNKTYISISKDRLSAEAYNILIAVNNPESEALGFKFTDVIIDIAKEHLDNVEDLKSSDKQIFTQGMTKLVQGVASLINPTSMIGSAIQFISGFVPNRVKTALKDPLGTDFINKFKESLKSYRVYYATLDRYNGIFNEDLYNLDSKHSNLGTDINTYLKTIIEPTNIDLNSPLTPQINTLFDYSNSGKANFNHASYNSNPQIKTVIQSLSDLKNLVSDLKRYYEDYTQIVNRNFERNIQLLSKAKELPKAKIASIEDLEKKLTTLKDGKKDNAGNIIETGFMDKFSLNIKQISNYISNIE